MIAPMADDDEMHVPFTLRERRRIDRTERAVFGYADEDGVWVPGLLQNTADGVSAIKTIRKLVFGIVALAVVNSLHLYGLVELIQKMMTK
jgi:hypothetical protein